MITWIRNWVITIATAVIFITAVEMILPNNKMKKYVQFLLGLILISVVINPIIKIINNNTDVSAYIEKASQYFDDKKYEQNIEKYKQIDKENTLSVFKENIENETSKILKDKYPSMNYKVSANVKLDDNTNQALIQSVEVGVNDRTIEKVRKVSIGDSSVEGSNSVNIDTRDKIVSFLSEQLKINKEDIKIYKY
ncbi:MAG: stage III sporulation protein AF [Bacillota bacterium]|nr:stage III sporulation protein AF [Bacillota bacterium]